MTTQQDSHPLLVTQATRLHTLGIAAEVGKRTGQGNWSLEAYLATLPAPCEHCLTEAWGTKGGPKETKLYYFLVDPRAGLVMPCESAKITYRGDDTTPIPYDGQQTVSKVPYWALLHNGWANRNKPPRDCRTEFRKIPGTFAARVMDSVFGYIDCSKIVSELVENPEGHAMDLAGSFHAPYNSNCARIAMYGRGV